MLRKSGMQMRFYGLSTTLPHISDPRSHYAVNERPSRFGAPTENPDQNTRTNGLYTMTPVYEILRKEFELVIVDLFGFWDKIWDFIAPDQSP